jgi:hypothetical protein
VRHLVGKVKHGKQIDDSEGETRDEESSIGSIPGCGIGSGAEPAGRGFGSLGQLDKLDSQLRKAYGRPHRETEQARCVATSSTRIGQEVSVRACLLRPRSVPKAKNSHPSKLQ